MSPLIQDQFLNKITQSLLDGRPVIWLSDLDGTLQVSDPHRHLQLRVAGEVQRSIFRFNAIQGLAFGVSTARPLEYFTRNLGMSGTGLQELMLICSNGLEVSVNRRIATHPRIGEGLHDYSAPFMQRLQVILEILELQISHDPSKVAALNRDGIDAALVENLPTGIVLHATDHDANGEPVMDLLTDAITLLVANTWGDSVPTDWRRCLGEGFKSTKATFVESKFLYPNPDGQKRSTIVFRDLLHFVSNHPFNGMKIIKGSGHYRFDYPWVEQEKIDKGTQVRLLKEAGFTVIFSGDDLGDLPGINAADLSVAVKRDAATPKESTPIAVVKSCDASVESPQGLAALIDTVSERVERLLVSDQRLAGGAAQCRIDNPLLLQSIVPWDRGRELWQVQSL